MRGKTSALMLCALLPAGVWVGAMKIIEATIGAHSTAGMWGLFIGFPGDLLGIWIGQWTDSGAASYVGAFLGICLFWLGLFKAATALKNRLSRS
jgi:hypothetical protein